MRKRLASSAHGSGRPMKVTFTITVGTARVEGRGVGQPQRKRARTAYEVQKEKNCESREECWQQHRMYIRSWLQGARRSRMSVPVSSACAMSSWTTLCSHPYRTMSKSGAGPGVTFAWKYSPDWMAVLLGIRA